jgi:hypothetical protein
MSKIPCNTTILKDELRQKSYCDWHYGKFQKLGEGKQAPVYEVCCGIDDCNYALKFYDTDKISEEKFRQEVYMHTRFEELGLSVPIIEAFYCPEHGGYIIMEHRDKTVEQYICALIKEGISKEKIKEKIEEIHDKIQNMIKLARSYGLYHNDTTLQNIMLNVNKNTLEYSDLCLVDFGKSTEGDHVTLPMDKYINGIRLTFNMLYKVSCPENKIYDTITNYPTYSSDLSPSSPSSSLMSMKATYIPQATPTKKKYTSLLSTVKKEEIHEPLNEMSSSFNQSISNKKVPMTPAVKNRMQTSVIPSNEMSSSFNQSISNKKVPMSPAVRNRMQTSVIPSNELQSLSPINQTRSLTKNPTKPVATRIQQSFIPKDNASSMNLSSSYTMEPTTPPRSSSSSINDMSMISPSTSSSSSSNLFLSRIDSPPSNNMSSSLSSNNSMALSSSTVRPSNSIFSPGFSLSNNSDTPYFSRKRPSTEGMRDEDRSSATKKITTNMRSEIKKLDYDSDEDIDEKKDENIRIGKLF